MAVQLASASAEISAWMVSDVPEVIGALRQLLHSEDERTRAKVCFWFVDRLTAMGGQLDGDARILAPMPKSLSGLLEVAPESEGDEVA